MKSHKMIILYAVMVFFLSGIPSHHAEAADDECNENYRAMLYGVIESMPTSSLEGMWTINDKEILVAGDTIIKEEFGKAEIGAYVEIEGDYKEKIFKAYRVEVKKSKN